MNCTNPNCRTELSADHVVLVTTCHVRRFCPVECITESHRLHYEAVLGDLSSGESETA